MSNEEALLKCSFGWGKTCRLYLDSIEIAGKSYNLDDLISVHSTYRSIFGVPSARIELFFGLHRLVLRGISDLETARSIVSHLRPYCSTQLHIARPRSRSTRTRNLARAQARAWERTNRLPTIPVSPEKSSRSFSKDLSRSLKHPSAPQLSSLLDFPSFELSFDELALSETPLMSQNAPSESLFTAAETLKSPAQLPDELVAQANPWSASHLRPLHMPRLQPPLRSVHLVPPGQKMLDSCSMPVPAIKSSVLPIIHVPVRLQPGECAHYSIGATLCSDRLSGSDRAPYPPLDHGLLILTNRRLFYTGKRSQLILAYTHLWYVSLLHNAIALHIERQFRRIIIELEHPQEWASRIEQLSFIAHRSQPRPELPTLLISALPGLPPFSLNAATLKRPALHVQALEDHTTSPDAQTPLLAERVESKIVEAETISLNEQADPQPANEEIHVSSTPPVPGEIATPDSSQEPMLANLTTQDLPQQPVLGEITTQDLPQQPVLGETTTQELSPVDEAEEAETMNLYSLASSRAWDERNCEEVDTLPLLRQEDMDDWNVPTVYLRKRRSFQPRTISRSVPVSDKLPDLETTPRRFPRACGPRFYAKQERPG